MNKNVLKTTATGTLASLLALSSPNLPAQEVNVGMGSRSSLERTVKEDAGIKGINKKIAQGLRELKEGRGPKGYRAAYNMFVGSYKEANDGIARTGEDVYRVVALVASMHAAMALLNAGNNIVEGRRLGDKYRGNNLQKALEHYRVALQLREHLDNKGNPVSIVNSTELGAMKVADEKFIREKMVQAYEGLIQLTQGGERQLYQRELIKTYNRLAELAEGPQRFNYQALARRVSMELGRR